MANPFSIQVANVTPGLNAAFTGLQKGLQAKQERETQSLQEQQQQAKTAQLVELYKSGKPGEVADFLIKNPDLADQFTKAKDVGDTLSREEDLQQAWDIYTGKVEPTQGLVKRGEEVLKRGGDITQTLNLLQAEQEHPGMTKREAEGFLARYDQEALKTYREGQQGPKVTGLTASQKDYRLAKQEGFKGTFMDYRKAISNQSGLTDLETMKLKTQIMDIQERIQERANKREERKAIKSKKIQGLLGGFDSVIEEIDGVTRAAENSTSTTGYPGMATAIVPTSPSYNMRKKLEVVKANLGFDKLQQMRDSSPTGGALGQVSERELAFLQSTVASLDPNMGQEAFVKSLRKVKRHYLNWRDTVLGKDPYERVVGESSKFGKITEGDIQETMRAQGMSREDVLASVGLK